MSMLIIAASSTDYALNSSLNSAPNSSLAGSLGSSILALSLLAFTTSITPGPNTLMLLASGLRFGLRRSGRHCVGVASGLAVVLLACSAGLGALLARWPWLGTALAAICAVWLLGLAVKLCAAPLHAQAGPAERPLGFVPAVLLQFVNPKVWAMAVSGVSLALHSGLSWPARTALIVLLFSAINLPCMLIWAAAGVRLQHWLAIPARQRLLTWGLASLLVVAALLPVAPLLRPLPSAPDLASADDPALSLKR